MWDFVKDVWRFVRHRDSDSACCLIIGMGTWLTLKHKSEMAGYFHALWEADNPACGGVMEADGYSGNKVVLLCRQCGASRHVSREDHALGFYHSERCKSVRKNNV